MKRCRTIKGIRPADVKTNRPFYDTFGQCEQEIIARNICLLAKRRNMWSFTWRDYRAAAACDYEVEDAEHEMLDAMAADGYLRRTGQQYCVTLSFINHIAEYTKEIRR